MISGPKSLQNFEKRATIPLGNCHSLNLNVSWDKKLTTSHRTTNYSMTKSKTENSCEIKDSDVTKLNTQCIFLYYTIETSVIWHSYVVHVWNFLNFLQKIRRPKSSDSFAIRILCKHSLRCPQDPISTEQKDWLLRSQKWTTSIFSFTILIHNEENRFWELWKRSPKGICFNLSSNSLN